MKVVEEFQPDIIYAHHTVPNGYFAFRIHKQTRIPYFVTEHDMDEVACSISFRKRLQVYEKVFVNATRVVAISKLMEAEMQKIVPSVETEVIYSP
jgi:ribosomal protein L32E